MNDDEKGMYVKICGETVRVFADESPEYIQRITDHINNLIDAFDEKKGRGVRQTLLLVYATLELCDALFKERERTASSDERTYEALLLQEKKAHKKTQLALAASESRLASTEKQLQAVQKDLDDFIKAFDESANS